MFQSTLPTRGATRPSMHIAASTYFNPRSPRGERRKLDIGSQDARSISIHAPHEGSDVTVGKAIDAYITSISIHAPHEGSDHALRKVSLGNADFNPRSPRGERPPVRIRLDKREAISIHAPHEGSDGRGFRHIYVGANFNPRSPRGERHFGARPGAC